MGRPKKCDYSPNPYLTYITTSTTTTTTTPYPLDLSSYINIPTSGASCPTTTTTTTTSTTTTLPPFDPDYPCASYSYLPDDQNGAVLKFAPCDNDNSVNQIIVGTIQRLDFCAERSSPVSILSGNGRLVYNGGCDRFVNIIQTTTTTTTTTTLPPLLSQLPSPYMYGLITPSIHCPYTYYDYYLGYAIPVPTFAPLLNIYISPSPFFDLLLDGKTINIYWNAYRIDYLYSGPFDYYQSEPIPASRGYFYFDKFNMNEDKLVYSACMYYENNCEVTVSISNGIEYKRRVSDHYFTAQAFVTDESYAESELIMAGSWCFANQPFQ